MKRLGIEHIAILIAAILLIYILMVHPIIGVADNGDFGRIIGSTGLKYIPQDNRDRYFEFVNRLYKSTSPLSHYTGYFSSEISLVIAAKLLNNLIFADKSTFDIRCLAIIYSLILLLAIYLNIKYNKTRKAFINLILAALAVFIFTDVGYISYFNSFYGEAVSFVSLLSTIGFAYYICKQKYQRNHMLLGFFLSAAILTGAKLQNAPIGLILIIFSIGLARLRRDWVWRGTIVVSSVFLLSIMTISYFTTPKDIRVCNKYQSVFFGVLKGSITPEKDLKELGIDQDLAVLAGTNYFMRKYPLDVRNSEITKEISDKINPVKIALFYVKHPYRYIQKLKVTARNSFKLIQGFGNYEKSYHPTAKRVVSSFRFWSDFKMKVLPHSLILIFLLYLFYYSVLIVYYFRNKDVSQRLYLEVFMLVGAIGILQFVIPVIGDGEADISKHLFLFNVCFDIMFITSIIWVVHIISEFAKNYVILGNSVGLFIKSAFVGGIASLVDISLFSIFTSILSINYLISNTFSFIFGLVVNYLLNRQWVFGNQTNNLAKDFMLFSLIGLVGLVMSNFFLYILIDMKTLQYLIPLSEDIIKPFAKGLVIILIFIWNFAARKKFVFTA